jgi:hypothetical protein
MFRVNRIYSGILALVLIITASFLTGCNSTATTSTTPPTTIPPTTTQPVIGGPGGGAIINSDSLVTAQIQAINKQASGYPWQLDVLIQSSVDVGTLPNPTKDSVGKVISVKTDQDMTTFKVNDAITAKVKYVGDVPLPGITLYIYNIALAAKPY